MMAENQRGAGLEQAMRKADLRLRRLGDELLAPMKRHDDVRHGGFESPHVSADLSIAPFRVGGRAVAELTRTATVSENSHPEAIARDEGNGLTVPRAFAPHAAGRDPLGAEQLYRLVEGSISMLVRMVVRDVEDIKARRAEGSGESRVTAHL